MQIIKKLIKDNQFARFLLVGALNTVFGYSIYALFLFIGFHYAVAVLISTVLGVLFNFKTIGKIVFKSSNNNLIFKFIGIYTVAYIMNIGFLRVFDIFKFDMYLAGVLLLLPMAAITFTLNKKFVFGRE